MNRPPEISSTVSAILAVRAGLRSNVLLTNGPSWMRLVLAAMAARIDQQSQAPCSTPSQPGVSDSMS